MMTKTVWALFTCFAGSITLVVVLMLMSGNLSKRPNSFLRALPPHPVIQMATFDVGFNSYYIAGASNKSFFLGNATAPLHVLRFDLSLSDSQSIKIEMDKYIDTRFWSVKVRVDSPAFYMTDGTVPVILKGNVRDWKIDGKMTGGAYFVDIEPLGWNSFAIRSLSAKSHEYVLGREIPELERVEFKDGILEKQIDGQFCVDGMMEFDNEGERLIYVYYYRNQFIVMDSLMNVQNRGRTIDTTSVAKLRVAKIRSDNSVTLASPPAMVNKHMSVYGNWLFVDSDLMARNESERDFRKVSVIDVYDVVTGTYQFSFYLAHFSGMKVSDFKVVKHRLIAVFGRHIVVFKMSPRYFAKLFRE